MARLPNSGNHSKKKPPHFEDLRRRHRNADCKYRSKVQYLYFKIRSLIKKKTAKDGLLDNALGLIQNLENEIYQTLGSGYMENCRKEFLSFLVKEEALWKKEKDVTKWWSNIEDLLSKKQLVDLKVNESIVAIDSEVIDKNKDYNQHDKSSKRPYRRSLISSKRPKNVNYSTYGKCCCATVECASVLQSNNEEFQSDINISDEKEDSLTSTSWNAPKVTDFSPVDLKNSKGTIAYEETCLEHSTPLKSKKVCNTKDVSIPLKNFMADSLEHTKSHLFYLGSSYVEL